MGEGIFFKYKLYMYFFIAAQTAKCKSNGPGNLGSVDSNIKEIQRHLIKVKLNFALTTLKPFNNLRIINQISACFNTEMHFWAALKVFSLNTGSEQESSEAIM